MKKKNLIIAGSALAIVSLAVVTAFGSNELRSFNNNSQPVNINKNIEAISNNPTNNYQYVNLLATTSTSLANSNVQEIVTQLEPSSYPALVVQKGIPVKWTMVADSKNLNSCNDEIIIPSLGISKPLIVGENVIEFTPTETGIIQYSCWMNMINSTIAVVDDINNYDKAEIESQIAKLPQGGGSCSMGGLFGGSSTNGASVGGCCGSKR